MDEELRDYLDQQFKSIDERFRENSEQLQQFRQETTERFEGVDQRFEGIGERFGGLEQRLERVETGVRENRVLIEALDGKVQLVAEGVISGNESREAFQEEVAKEFKEVRATMNLHFSHLDPRVKKLERARRPRKQAPARVSSR